MEDVGEAQRLQGPRQPEIPLETRSRSAKIGTKSVLSLLSLPVGKRRELPKIQRLRLTAWTSCQTTVTTGVLTNSIICTEHRGKTRSMPEEPGLTRQRRPLLPRTTPQFRGSP